MSKKQKFTFLFSFSGLLLISLMVLSGLRNPDREVTEVEVEIEDQKGILFTDNLEIIDLMTDQSGDYVIGVEMGDLNHKVLESRIEANPFVKEAEVYRDLEGTLLVEVEQSKPIARVFNRNKEDYYIDSEGNILPTNAKYTARVPIVETDFDFSWEKNLDESKYGEQLLNLLRFIEADTFWKAQIAQLRVKNDGEIEMYPQVTKQTIQLGQPQELDEKFARLMTFYKKILPQKGWNAYEVVNVKFDNQIICE